MEASDATLLRQFIASRDEPSFRELVSRHFQMVWSVARRVIGNDTFAEDITQQTFIRLVQRASAIGEEQNLAAWLHRTARSFAIDLVRREGRRKTREAKATAMENDPSHEVSWEKLAPVIDSLVGRLSPQDQQIILLRNYENRPIASVGIELGLSEQAARKRAQRALEKLRTLFQKRGLATSTGTLSTLLPVRAITVVPAGKAASISAAALVAPPIASAGVLSSLLTMSSSTKIGIAVTALLALILITKLGKGPSSTSSASENPSSGQNPPMATRPPRPHTTEAQEVEATKKAAMASVREQQEEILRNGYEPVLWVVFGPGGRLTTGASEAAKLTEEEKDAVGRIIKGTWVKAAADFAARAKLEPDLTDVASGILAYHIAATPDRGAGAVEELRNSLNAVIGRDRQEVLMKGFSPYDCFGGMGRGDVNLEFYTKEGVYKYEYTNPATGKPTRFGSSSFDSFTAQFGEIGRFIPAK